MHYKAIYCRKRNDKNIEQNKGMRAKIVDIADTRQTFISKEEDNGSVECLIDS